ncbi:uncharacterized protein LOC115885125 [Sitophilus oryzae]|nr:uncharacterized protein LOC115885125 [Sitophilus oryzae]
MEKLNTIESMTQSNRQSIIKMEGRMDNLEYKIRQNSLRVVGLEDGSDENLVSKMLTLLNDAVRVKCCLQEINNVYRMGKMEIGKSRVTIVSFTSVLKRNEVFNNRRNLKGTGIYINEDLTAKQHQVLLAARRKYGMRNAWSTYGRILVNDGNSVQAFKEADNV